ncbi:MAG: hypothetical protein HQ582_24015 [Planctomycetes bacterium]|nr:hypothetical protein [Planctomycetota bacterium]
MQSRPRKPAAGTQPLGDTGKREYRAVNRHHDQQPPLCARLLKQRGAKAQSDGGHRQVGHAEASRRRIEAQCPMAACPIDAPMDPGVGSTRFSGPEQRAGTDVPWLQVEQASDRRELNCSQNKCRNQGKNNDRHVDRSVPPLRRGDEEAADPAEKCGEDSTIEEKRDGQCNAA